MPRVTRVRDLRKAIEGLPDDAIVVTPAFDHSYSEASVSAGTALYDKKTCVFSEDHGEEMTPEAEYGKRIPVLIVS